MKLTPGQISGRILEFMDTLIESLSEHDRASVYYSIQSFLDGYLDESAAQLWEGMSEDERAAFEARFRAGHPDLDRNVVEFVLWRAAMLEAHDRDR